MRTSKCADPDQIRMPLDVAMRHWMRGLAQSGKHAKTNLKQAKDLAEQER